jgi:AraC-like DNA-binding protein
MCGANEAGFSNPAALTHYHFARQFKAATGLPPHRYAILHLVGVTPGRFRTPARIA